MDRLFVLYAMANEYFHVLLQSESRYIILGLLAVILALIIGVAIVIIKQIHFRDTLKQTKQLLIMSHKRLDEKAKTQLISRLQVSSDESYFKVKLGILESLDLRLIERSNVRSHIPFLNVYTLIALVFFIFISALSPIYSLFNSWYTAILLSFFVALTPTILLDTLSVYNMKTTRRTTANFLTLLLSWLEVKNDLLFAFEKVKDDVEAPLKFYISDSVAQLKSGINPEHVFDILSYKVNTNQFYTIAKNFKSVFKNGGDIVGLVKVLEEEAYMVDNEFETRVTDTFMTRMLLNILLLGAIFFLLISILIDPTLKDLYTNTVGGKRIMFASTFIFVVGFLMNLKSDKQDY